MNHVLFDRSGALVAKLEFAWDPERVIVECDGLRFHTTPSQKAYDDHRQNRLILDARIVLRYGWGALEEPDRIVGEIAEALLLGRRIAGALAPRTATAT